MLECFLLYVVLRALENGVVHTDCDPDQAERTGPGRENANYRVSLGVIEELTLSERGGTLAKR
jgi:hypothetical protein